MPQFATVGLAGGVWDKDVNVGVKDKVRFEARPEAENLVREPLPLRQKFRAEEHPSVADSRRELTNILALETHGQTWRALTFVSRHPVRLVRTSKSHYLLSPLLYQELANAPASGSHQK